MTKVLDPPSKPAEKPAEPEAKAGPPVQFSSFAFTVHLQSDAEVNPLGNNVLVVAVDVESAQQAVRDNFGDDLVNITGGATTTTGLYLAASIGGGGGKKGFLNVTPKPPAKKQPDPSTHDKPLKDRT